MRRLAVPWWWFLAWVVLVVAACGSISASDQAQAVTALGEMLRAGVITQAQYDALVGALTGSGWEWLVQLALGVGGALLGVRVAPVALIGRSRLAAMLASAVAASQAPPSPPATPPPVAAPS